MFSPPPRQATNSTRSINHTVAPARLAARARRARRSWQSERGPPHLVAAAVEAAVKLVKDAVVLVQVDQLRAARQLVWEPFTALQGWN